LDIKGKIDISKAEKRYQLIEDHTWYQFHHESPVESTLKNVYFGLELCNNKIGNVKFNTVYELKKRIYLGPTSADNDLAFMMCNQAKIGQGSFVIDPFVGTGGLIIPPASKGAYVFGCDLDMRVLNGYSVGRINKRSPFYSPEKKLEIFTPKIELSFEQYGFPYPNIFRMDSTNLAFKG
jgi:tRNA (guanine10-N2)-methyltransferase